MPSSQKLVVLFGDVSDADGFIALAMYFRAGADVLFINSVPSFYSDAHAPVDNLTTERAPFLGYNYSRDNIVEFRNVDVPSYEVFNDFVAKIVTSIQTQVQQTHAQQKPRLYLVQGGVNTVQPFSGTVVKIDPHVYASVELEQAGCPWSTMTDIDGVLAEYTDITLDFSGSAAFFDTEWQTLLDNHLQHITRVLVMGGVRADAPPQTIPRVPGILNRASLSTMNQFYAPVQTAAFFDWCSLQKLPVEVVTNNAVRSVPSDQRYQLFEALLSGRLLAEGGVIRQVLDAYYKADGKAVKVFDAYTAQAFLEPKAGEKARMFYDNVYGACLVAPCSSHNEIATGQAALEEYCKHCNPMECEALKQLTFDWRCMDVEMSNATLPYQH